MNSLTTEAFVLAGGASRRMGRDKASLDWYGKPLLAHMISLLSTVSTRVRVAGRADLPDLQSGLGPMAGILTALTVTTADLNFVVAVDLPLLTEDFLKYFALQAHLSSLSLLACRTGTEIPLCLAIRRAVLPLAQNYVVSGRRSIRGFVEAAKGGVLSENELLANGFPPEIFHNLNTPEEYRRLFNS